MQAIHYSSIAWDCHYSLWLPALSERLGVGCRGDGGAWHACEDFLFRQALWPSPLRLQLLADIWCAVIRCPPLLCMLSLCWTSCLVSCLPSVAWSSALYDWLAHTVCIPHGVMRQCPCRTLSMHYVAMLILLPAACTCRLSCASGRRCAYICAGHLQPLLC